MVLFVFFVFCESLLECLFGLTNANISIFTILAWHFIHCSLPLTSAIGTFMSTNNCFLSVFEDKDCSQVHAQFMAYSLYPVKTSVVGLDQLFSTYYSILQFSNLLPIILIERSIFLITHYSQVWMMKY